MSPPQKLYMFHPNMDKVERKRSYYLIQDKKKYRYLYYLSFFVEIIYVILHDWNIPITISAEIQ